MHIIQMAQEQHAIYFGYAFFRRFRLIWQESWLKNIYTHTMSSISKASKYNLQTISICLKLNQDFICERVN